MSTESQQLEIPQEPIPKTTVFLMAITVGVVVANIYYIQPLLAAIAQTFGMTVTNAGVIAMLSQAGTAVGMFLFVPLGDKFERRSLIITLLFASCGALLLFAIAPNVLLLAFASFAVGACAANVHVVVPFAAFLSTPEQRGRVVGTMISGILLGVLLARTFSGSIGAWFGWRVVYFIAAGMMLLLAAVVRTSLPVSRPHKFISWGELMLSTLHLVQRHAMLRESAFLGALLFGAFSAFWTTLVFLLESPAYGYAKASAVAGLFGLVGAVGAAGAPTFGHLASKHGPRMIIRAALWLGLASFILLGAAGHHFAGLIAGVILMDLCVQTGHVANQTRIYGIDRTAQSRLNMVYMFCYFTGGGLGSCLGAICWHHLGWWGVCGFASALLALGLLIEMLHGKQSA